MNQRSKIFIGISVAAAAIASFMLFSKSESVKKRTDSSKIKKQQIPDKRNTVDPDKEYKKQKEKKSKLIVDIKALIKKTNVDAFDNISDAMFNEKFNYEELNDLYWALMAKSKYNTEKEFRDKERVSFEILNESIAKANKK